LTLGAGKPILYRHKRGNKKQEVGMAKNEGNQCPLLWGPCKLANCAWWIQDKGTCSVLGIALGFKYLIEEEQKEKAG
jgi:hypothetical protein